MNVDAIGMVLPRLAAIYIWVIIALVFVGVPVLIIIYLLGLAKRQRNMGKEWKLFRIELGKLADEIQRLRQESNGNSQKKESNNDK